MPGFAAFFKKSSEEERAHGLKLVEYQNKRGGKVVFQDIARPSATEWGTPLEALEAALELEKTVSILEDSNLVITSRYMHHHIALSTLRQRTSVLAPQNQYKDYIIMCDS